jgi:hypothetical protein
VRTVIHASAATAASALHQPQWDRSPMPLNGAGIASRFWTEHGMNIRCTVGFLAICAISTAADLRPEAQKAWDEYLQGIDLRATSSQFLWLDQDPQRVARVRQGEILAESQLGPNDRPVSNGVIHDWIGAIFLRGVTPAQVSAVMSDYTRYPEFYCPAVIDAALLTSNGQEDRLRVRYFRKVLFVSETLDAEYQVRHVQVDARRWYTIAQSTRLTDVGEQGSRYLWRLYTVSRFEQRDGGVYMEQENIVLSRAIPAGFRWLVEPAIRQLSRDLVAGSLRQTRDAVESTAKGIDVGRMFKPTQGPASP